MSRSVRQPVPDVPRNEKTPCYQGAFSGAGDQIRTGDPHLGKVILRRHGRCEICIFPGQAPYQATAFALGCGSLQMTHGRNMAGLCRRSSPRTGAM